MQTFVKNSADDLDYGFDWADPDEGPWLEENDTVADAEWTVTPDDADEEGGLVKGSEARTDTVTMQWFSGGVLGTRYRVSCLMTTTAGRKAKRSLDLVIAVR